MLGCSGSVGLCKGMVSMDFGRQSFRCGGARAHRNGVDTGVRVLTERMREMGKVPNLCRITSIRVSWRRSWLYHDCSKKVGDSFRSVYDPPKQTVQTYSLIRNILAISQNGHFLYKLFFTSLIAFM